jgi:hypothetical protein
MYAPVFPMEGGHERLRRKFLVILAARFFPQSICEPEKLGWSKVRLRALSVGFEVNARARKVSICSL